MDTSGSITQFFYNIIPGSLFIFVLALVVGFPPDLFHLLLQKNWVFPVFIFLSLALLVGFSFQVMTKIDRKYPFKEIKEKPSDDRINKFASHLNKLIMKIIKHPVRNLNSITWDKIKEDKTSYEVAREILKGVEVSGMRIFYNKDNDERLFYLMHNYLFAEHKDKQADFYMGRIAFWANIYYGTLILSMISAICFHIGLVILFLILVWLSRWPYHEYLKNQYDVVLKTFILVYKDNSLPLGK